MFDATKFDRFDPVTEKMNPKGSEFIIEIAELQHTTDDEAIYRFTSPPRGFALWNCPLPGMYRSFHFVKADKSGGDIAGWRFEEDNGPNKGNDSYLNSGNVKRIPPFTVLIIND